MPYPNLLARGVLDIANFEAFELFAGESDIVTSEAMAYAPIRQFALLKRSGPDSSSVMELTSLQDVCCGIAAQPAVAGAFVPFFTGGVFNFQALVLPDATTNWTSILDGTNMTFGNLL